MTKSSNLHVSSATWWETATARLAHLRTLGVGWDGYDGRPLGAEMTKLALEVLEGVCDATTPPPSLVPGGSGDLQIEWHTRSWDLEIDIVGQHQIAVWRREASSSIEEELTISDDFGKLRRWVADLEEPAIAPRTTTA